MQRWVVVAALLGAVGCRDRQLTQLQAVRDEVCACKTVACAEAAMGKVPQKDPRTDHHKQAVANEMLDCLSKLYDADRPSADLDQEHESGSGSAAP